MARTDPHSFTDTDQGVVTALDWAVELDFASRRLHGSATLRLAEVTGGPFDLDTRGLTIRDVHTGRGEAVAWRLSEPRSFLGSRLRLELPAGTDAVTLRYETAPDATALHWLDPAQTAGGRHPYLLSQCQPIHARSIVPIQDSPRVRFPYAARITAPDPLTAILSAAPGTSRADPRRPGTRTFQFVMPQRIPAYLLALAVGEIDGRDLGPRTRVYAEPSVLDAAAWEFAEVERLLGAAEGLFGPYRWERFDFVVMPPSFPYGGMENPRLTFLTPTLLAGDRSLVDVLAHELAHSWTGNLVTNASMEHFWLNEGFTVWAERRILEALRGAEAVAFAAAIGRHDLDADLERLGRDSGLTRLETELEGIDPDAAFSVVPYEKGFLFLTLLERTAGRKAFDAFVRGYLDRFAFTSVTTAEFEALLEQELPGLAARVGAERWLREPGIPANAPTLVSERLTALKRLAAEWPSGARPAPEASRDWGAAHWQVYLRHLPRPLPEGECRWLDETFALSRVRNREVLCQWLLIAAASGYAPAFATLREFVGSVGRIKYLRPLYRALHAGVSTRALARELFERHGGAYHPVTRAAIAATLE